MNKLDGGETESKLDEKTKQEIEYAFDRLVNKVLHTPMESLRDEAKHGTPTRLLEALVHLFKLED